MSDAKRVIDSTRKSYFRRRIDRTSQETEKLMPDLETTQQQEHSWYHPTVLKVAAAVSVLSTSVTKQTGDMVYSEARQIRMPGIWAHTKMMYALERESDLGSTFAVLVELSEEGNVSGGPVP